MPSPPGRDRCRRPGRPSNMLGSSRNLPPPRPRGFIIQRVYTVSNRLGEIVTRWRSSGDLCGTTGRSPAPRGSRQPGRRTAGPGGPERPHIPSRVVEAPPSGLGGGSQRAPSVGRPGRGRTRGAGARRPRATRPSRRRTARGRARAGPPSSRGRPGRWARRRGRAGRGGPAWPTRCRAARVRRRRGPPAP